nr:ADP-ribose glycohydrolase-like protein [Salmonid herpesvirus 1]
MNTGSIALVSTTPPEFQQADSARARKPKKDSMYSKTSSYGLSKHDRQWPLIPKYPGLITYVPMNLFAANKDDHLVHCVSRDLHMGAGIAKTFKHMYPEMIPAIRGSAVLHDFIAFHPDDDSPRLIFNLITKIHYRDLPTKKDLFKTLIALRDYCLENEIVRLCMPKIASGLDKIPWATTIYLLNYVFGVTDVKLFVYTGGPGCGRINV